MVYEQGRRHLPIACRYVPYDQWFITHIDPTWKIKHLKQRIISKCLNLPFDPRFIQQGISPGARPPSPITFAPDASMRPDSPIKFTTPTSDGPLTAGAGVGGDDQESTGVGDEGYEGYEEDDEWEQDFDIAGSLHGGKIGPKVKSKSSNPTTVSPSFYVRLQQKQKQEEQQITTHIYTLFRFSTGQILEEDFQISWYDIQPHELVELHSSFSPPTFSSSLFSPMSLPSPKTSVAASSQKTLTAKKKKSSSKSPTDQRESLTLSVAALPRHLPNLYIQPYWQGWVRALSVLLSTQMVRAGDEYPHPLVDDSLKGGRGEGGERRDRKHVEKVEWKESWVVIHDGVVNVCKSPTDQNPIRLLLSSLVALRGPEHLANSIYAKNGTRKPPVRSKSHTSEPSTMSTTTGGTLRTGSHIQSGPSTTSKDLPKQVGKSQETAENVSDKDPKRNTRNLKKTRKDGKSQENGNRERDSGRILQVPHISTSQEKERRTKSSRDKDKNKTFIPTSREEAEQAGMRVVCAIFRVQPDAGREWDKLVGDITQAGGFPKARRYTSTGPSLALVAAPAPDAKMKGSTGPHVVIDSDVYVGETPVMDFKDVHGRHQPQPQSQRTLISSSPFSLSSPTTTGAATDSAAAAPVSPHPAGFTWNLFGSKEKIDVKERKATERRGTPDDHHGLLPPLSATAEDFDISTPTIANSLGWKSFHPTKLKIETSRSTESGGEDDVKGYAAEPSDMVALSPMTSPRPTVITSNLTPVLPTPTTATIATMPPESQPSDQGLNNPNSDSDSSVSISSPVFAHDTNESDLDDETFLSYGSGAGSASVSNSNKPRKGYRYGGYHVQAQTMKGKSDYEGEDERLLSGDGDIGKEAEGEVDADGRLGDCNQAQQATPEENEQERRNGDHEREVWITLDMINDCAFNSILRILHRHSPLPLSSSFTPSHSLVGSPTSPQSPISNKSKSAGDLHHASNAVPSDTDDDSRYVARNPTNHRAIHPPILESLVARTALNHSAQQPLYVALPYPEWRLELVNRARRAGMREIGRPLDLALHGWGREFEEMAAAVRERKLEREKEKEREKKEKRKSAQSHVSTIKERERRVSRVIGGSDADDDADDDLGDGDEEEEEAMRRTQLDSDSEEESDTEWLAWMTDLPRQFLVQQTVQPSQPISTTTFTNPFSSSSTLVDGEPVRPPRTQEEERLLHADKLRKLEPSAISTVIPPLYPPSPTSNPFADPPNRISTLSSQSFEPLDHQRNSSSNHNLTPFPGVSPMDEPPVNTGRHSRSQSRSLQHLGSYRQVVCVPEEGGDGYNPASLSSSSLRQGLHHSASVDRHLSRKIEVISRRQSVSTAPEAAEKLSKYALGKPILTNEQIMKIESEVIASAPHSSLPSHWTFPPIPMPSPPPNRPSTSSHTPSHMSSASTSTSTSTPRPPPSPASFNTSGSTGGGVEVKVAPMSSAINRFTSSDLARWSSSVGISLQPTSLSTPSSPSASTSAHPNSASPPRSSVFGSLARSPSLLGKGAGQEKEKKGFLRKRMSRDLGKDKEKDKDKDTGECSTSSNTASLTQRPRLVLSGLSSSTSSVAHRNYPSLLDDIPPSPTHNPNPTGNNHLYHSPGAISSARALLRRVRSGSSLRGEESANTSLFTTSASSSAGLGVTPPETEVQKKKKGPLDRIVKGFDSSLAFAEGR